MQRALLAALLVGLTAPAVGIFLVQRRLALIGDGIGHVALTGVALGLLTGAAPVLDRPGRGRRSARSLIELLRPRGRTSGDVALAVMFYGGIAGGVVLDRAVAGGSSANLNAYLFGSHHHDHRRPTSWPSRVLAVVVLGACPSAGAAAVRGQQRRGVRPGQRACRCSALNLLLAVLTAVTVVVSMRVVGLLLISALMIVPDAVAQQLCPQLPRDRRCWRWRSASWSASAGVVPSFYADTPSGGTIVLLAIAVFRSCRRRPERGAGVLHATRHARVEEHPHEHGAGLRAPGGRGTTTTSTTCTTATGTRPRRPLRRALTGTDET